MSTIECRLSKLPDPSVVRPEPVLQRALNRLIGMIQRREENSHYYQDQFKAMRQDCTVQRLKNGTAIAIYEAHARQALEYGDLGDFNQCQTQLLLLYKENPNSGSAAEFTAYKLLYDTVHARAGMHRVLLQSLQNITPELRTQPAVSHALQVRKAIFAGDFKAFFRLYQAAPNLGRVFMDVALPKLRYRVLNIMVRAVKPSAPLTFLAQTLGFTASSDGCGTSAAASNQQVLPGCRSADVQDNVGCYATAQEAQVACAEWLTAHGAVLITHGE